MTKKDEKAPKPEDRPAAPPYDAKAEAAAAREHSEHGGKPK